LPAGIGLLNEYIFIAHINYGQAMHPSQHDLGIIQVILERFEKQRLPRLLDLKKQVDANQSLDDYEVNFLITAIKDTQSILLIIERNPDYLPLLTKVIDLYLSIASKSLEIEENSRIKSI
jgi:hypothetical protein